MRGRLFLIFIALVMMLASCSLYLSDDEVDTIRTDEGYMDVEKIELPDGAGTVEYQYDEKTIAINDDVEQYVVRVESDSIVYFVDGTPDYYLPQVGEMMVCSFREKFPDAFCHRCIERKNENGLWRCVFTRCDMFDAFKVLKVKMNTNEQTEVIPAEGGRLLTDEEQDSLIASLPNDDAQNGESRGGSRRINYSKTFAKSVHIDNPMLTLGFYAGGDHIQGNFKAAMGTSMTVGASLGFEIDSDQELLEVTAGVFGNYKVVAEIEASAGITATLPASLPILGVKFDLLVLGLEAGITYTPYLTFRKKFSSKATYTLAFNKEFSFRCQGKDIKKGKLTVLNGSDSKMPGEPLLTFENRKEQNTAYGVEMGIDYSIGLGGKIDGAKVRLAAGCKLFSEIDFVLDDATFHSAADYQNSQANFLTKYQFYLQASLGWFAGVEAGFQSPVYLCPTHEIPLAPFADKKATSFSCIRHDPKTFEMKGVIDEQGLIGLLLGSGYYMNIYTTEGKELKSFLLPGTEGDLKHYALTKRIDEIQFNTPYIVQFAEKIGDFMVPLCDIPFEEPVPDMSILSATLKYTNRGDFLKPVKGTDQVNHYAYCYTIDVMVNIEAQRYIRKWGIHSNMYSGFNEIYAAEFERTNNGIDDMDLPVVRFRWYSNKPTIMVGFYPYCYVKSQKDRTLFPAVTKTYNYDPTLEYISPSDEKPDYDAEEDSER